MNVSKWPYGASVAFIYRFNDALAFTWREAVSKRALFSVSQAMDGSPRNVIIK
jgi:hypothetical protein